jgi:hypothetical protein
MFYAQVVFSNCHHIMSISMAQFGAQANSQTPSGNGSDDGSIECLSALSGRPVTAANGLEMSDKQ